MATREEWMAQLKKADAAAQAGNEEAKADFNRIRQKILDGDKNGTWGAGAPAAAGPAEGTDEKSFFQRVLDLTNAQTGESYLYGNNPKPDAFGDVTRIMRDTGSRGFADKLAGAGKEALGFGDEVNGAAQFTENARERTPGYVEAPADISAALASSPYRVGSFLGGGIAGGLEGAASAYGHQEGWMPEWGNIAKETAKGAALGSGAAKAGEWLGKGINALRGKPAISTADELLEAGEKAGKRKRPNKAERDILARTQRMKAAELAQAEGKGGFQKMFEGMDAPETEIEKVFGADKNRVQWPHDEKKIIAELANKPNKSARALDAVGKVVSGGNFFGSIPFAKHTSGIAPAVGAMFRGAAAMVDDVDPQTVDRLKSMILDSTGRLKADKKTIDVMRDALAKGLPRGAMPQMRNRGT